MNVLGVDGCRGGWVVAVKATGGSFRLEVQETIAEVFTRYGRYQRCFIDMPIGLPEAAPRACDTLARRLLGRRASTVFPVPCRSAVYAQSYRRACEINQACQGRRLSRQLWNIVPRIIEVDRLVRENAPGVTIHESHPELCFAALNGGQPLLSKKRERAGAAERLRLLEAVEPGIRSVYEESAGTLRRSGAMPDDLIDALVLAVSAALPPVRWRTLPDPPERDGKGLPMAIVAPGESDAPSTRRPEIR